MLFVLLEMDTKVVSHSLSPQTMLQRTSLSLPCEDVLEVYTQEQNYGVVGKDTLLLCNINTSAAGGSHTLHIQTIRTHIRVSASFLMFTCLISRKPKVMSPYLNLHFSD